MANEPSSPSAEALAKAREVFLAVFDAEGTEYDEGQVEAVALAFDSAREEALEEAAQIYCACCRGKCKYHSAGVELAPGGAWVHRWREEPTRVIECRANRLRALLGGGA